MTLTILFTFASGLFLGLLIGYWQKRSSQKKLRQLLKDLSDQHPENISLPLSNRLRREILRIQAHADQLQNQLELWQDLIEVAPIGYIQVDEENQLLWCNQQARQLLRLDRWKQGQVRLLLELVRSYELDQLIEETRKTQHPQIQEWVFHTTDFSTDTRGQSSPKNFTIAIALKGSSYPLPEGAVGVFLENQQPLVELSQRSDRLFSDLTHELRTPLTSIRLVAEALQTRLQPPESRWVEQMLQEANRLIRLIEDWLEISQLEKRPQQNLKTEYFALQSLITSAWETLKPLADQKQLQFIYQGEQSLFITADHSRLTQVFLNLFDNAIKYSPPESNIWVNVVLLPSHRINKPEDWVQINVIDQGQGLSKTDILRVFDRLYRGNDMSAEEKDPPDHSTTGFQSSGTGLGLSITRQIILAHEGRIQAKNHPDTGGAWLQIELPKVSLEEISTDHSQE
ncbi:PAS/PAC sensor signal transduction histidine kinase [Halothece sp. PCC 7418]|uniref:sensor histidine kinase n=1 Tax=Halothece sp. (strain PCC 7418) TaxID=65093 RepID=UPI0002A0868B|nr:ATP-binding protein [Halothece sp. PCC 7418]AFZ45243.1 PAS/PAC sensor signal transduction histidine kinase [Halothece sp. PCC 7418]